MRRQLFIERILILFFLLIFFNILTVRADQPLPQLSEKKFNQELIEMTVEYEREDITRIKAERDPYATERLILKSNDPTISPSEYGAIDGIHNKDGLYILQFDSERETKEAEIKLEQKDSTVYVVPDRYIFLNSTQGEVTAQVTYAEVKAQMGNIQKSIGADVFSDDLVSLNNSVTVAVLDTGVSYLAQELSGRIDTTNAYSFIDGCKVFVCEEKEEVCRNSVVSHGTNIAGIIAKCTEKVASKVKIMPVRVLDNEGAGYTSVVSQGIKYAADKGAKVINISIGGKLNLNSVMREAVLYANTKGTTVVVASGNNNDITTKYEPSNIKECIVVGAVDNSNNRAYFSNYGDTLDVVAPGVSILSCSYYFKLSEGKWIQVLYSEQSGTSMSAPHIAGAVALLKIKFPSANPTDIEKLIQQSTKDLGSTGWDKYYGYGLLDLSLLKGSEYNNVSKAYTYIESKKKEATVTDQQIKEEEERKKKEEEERRIQEAINKKIEEEKKRKLEEETKYQQEKESFERISKDTSPHANVDYIVPLKFKQKTNALKVDGLGINDYVVSWKSSNSTIATVQGNRDGTCIIRALKKKGIVTITAITASKRTIIFNIKVQKKKINLKGFNVKQKNIILKVGESQEINVTPYPITVTNKLKYLSSKKSVVKVTPKGILIAKKVGKSTVTVKCGNKKMKIKVTVIN